ncbi:DUF3857 domain-containing protein [Duganella sp. FT92W]|uniref:DUF3857 domain-containing protein n=1 Tax=Pseudoduganella rivuli TaxID=2666085 RepID=A0A7X2IRP6_9BURK|nr:DUF3857 domain-containing protein [Pseudoduganella rivuli]MRV74931.1 DUF3857 domain-containing protein [Pseudoduganella rivuli]
MMFFKNILAAISIGLLGCINIAYAGDDGTDTSFTHERFVGHYVVNKDGSYVQTTEHVLLIKEERAVKALAQQPIIYNSSLQKIEVVQAYTQKPDGRRVLVKPDQIKDQQERISTEAPMFQDSRVKVLIFPEVAVGDRLVYTYRVICTQPLYPGQFEDVTLGEFNAVGRMSMTYDMPEELPLYADSMGFRAAQPVAGAGRKIYRWDYVPGENQPIEAGAVAYTDYGRRLFVSTFADYAALARAYDVRASSKVIVDARITALAKQIVGNLADPGAKARAIHNWVRQNIRYVAVYVGPGGVVPHSSLTILDNRYGDCKDHVTLMEALLQAAGIDSTPALINQGPSYKLPSVPTTFNHVITYVPGLDLYLDSTSAATSENYLPDGDIDKAVLLTHTGTIAHTPRQQLHLIKNESEIEVLGNGTANFVQRQTTRGKAAGEVIYFVDNAMQSDLDYVVKKLVSSKGKNGAGSIKKVEASAARDNVTVELSGHENEFVDLPGPVAITLDSSLTNDLRNSLTPLTIAGNRSQDFICLNLAVEERASYTLPATLSALALPKSVSLQDDNFEYRSEYLMESGKIVVKRILGFKHPGAVCTASEYHSMFGILTRIIRDLRSQVILQSAAR